MLRNLKVGKKITLAFGVVMLLCFLVVVVSAVGLFSVAGGLESFYNHAYPIVSDSMQISKISTTIQRDVWKAYAVTDDSERQSLLAVRSQMLS